jgi:hypothetical protein
LPLSSTRTRPPAIADRRRKRNQDLIEDTHRQWLHQLAAACEHALAHSDIGDRAETHYAAVLEDVAALLLRIRTELAAEET